jgi:hypothetical protein
LSGAQKNEDSMEFMVEGRAFLSLLVSVRVAAADAASADAAVSEVAVAATNGMPAFVLRAPKSGRKGWRNVLLALHDGQTATLRFPAAFSLTAGDTLTLGCLGSVKTAGGASTMCMDLYAVTNEAAGQRHDFLDAASLMKRCGITRATRYDVEKYPLKKVCKVALTVFLVGLVCFGYLMHLFTENMDALVARLWEVLFMSAKFGAVALAVVAVGGGLYVKSSNDYNMKKKLDEYRDQFEQAMGVTPNSGVGV